MHLGENISRIREIRRIKQDFLAGKLGVSQQFISKIEQSEFVDADVLERIANALGVTVESIRNFNEDAVFNYLNRFNNGNENADTNYSVDAYNKLLELYERLLQSEREKLEILKSTVLNVNKDISNN